jgi:hypothetical protein
VGGGHRQWRNGSLEVTVTLPSPRFCTSASGCKGIAGTAAAVSPTSATLDTTSDQPLLRRAQKTRRVGVPVQPAALAQPRAAVPHAAATGSRRPAGDLPLVAQGRTDPASATARARCAAAPAQPGRGATRTTLAVAPEERPPRVPKWRPHCFESGTVPLQPQEMHGEPWHSQQRGWREKDVRVDRRATVDRHRRDVRQ